MSKKENMVERTVRDFAKTVFKTMKWGKMPVKRFKVGNMKQYRGYCMALSNDDMYIIISTNPDVYPENAGEKHFWACVLHELIHAYMHKKGYPVEMAFGHGKRFKHYCKMVEIATNGEFTKKELLK